MISRVNLPQISAAQEPASFSTAHHAVVKKESEDSAHHPTTWNTESQLTIHDRDFCVREQLESLFFFQ